MIKSKPVINAQLELMKKKVRENYQKRVKMYAKADLCNELIRRQENK